ncbi:MAG TPA: hypothetical protein VNM69_02210 [Bacillus sp. (in: firmicutes)]|nr:hypothetical protein [Bacillus sp. (in: firmicutes)]
MARKLSYYISGKVTTFTPSTNAEWVNEFNDIVRKEEVSRNSLTEKLIQEGLKTYNGNALVINVDGLTREQTNLLEETILNFKKMLLSSSAVAPSQPNGSQERVSPTLQVKPEAIEKAENKETQQPEPVQSVTLHSQVNEQLELPSITFTPKAQGAAEKPLSPTGDSKKPSINPVALKAAQRLHKIKNSSSS